MAGSCQRVRCLDWRCLAENATAISKNPARSTDVVIDDLIVGLRYKKRIGVVGVQPVRLPYDLALYVPLRQAAREALEGSTPAHVAALERILHNPQRAILLAASPGDSVDPPVQKVALVGIYRVDRGYAGGFVQLSVVPPPRGRSSEILGAEVVLGDSLADDGLPLRLEQLWAEGGLGGADVHQPGQLRPSTGVWLGSQGGATHSDTWVRRAKAMTAVRSLRLSVVVDPERNFRSARDKVIGAEPDIIFSPEQNLGPTAVAVAWEYRERFGATRVIEVEGDVIEHMLQSARAGLELIIRDRIELDRLSREAVLTWHDVAEEVDQLGPALVLTEQAREMLIDNEYPDPSRMRSHLVALGEVAKAWRAAQGDVGQRLGYWAHDEFGIEIALHGAGLQNTNFDHEGVTHNCEPHVKVDDYKNPAECGRIYFAIDRGGERFIVCYVGLHP